MSDKAFLTPTAALVMDLARRYYLEDPVTRKFFDCLDTSSAQALIEEHKRLGIYELTQELMCNRKFIVRHIVLQALAGGKPNWQIVILAAGKAPLALELLSRAGDRIARVFEVDIASLDQKQAIYQDLAPELSSKIEFCESDIRSPLLLDQLQALGLNRAVPSVIVLEGITHYLSPDDLRQILSSLSSLTHRGHHVILDYGQPYETIAPEVQAVARQAYRIIEEGCYLKPMTKHSPEGLSTLLQQLGGEVVRNYSIHEAERLRTGENKYFLHENSAWLEYLVARI